MSSPIILFLLGSIRTSLVVPNTLNLDPDPEFWFNLDPDKGFCYNF